MAPWRPFFFLGAIVASASVAVWPLLWMTQAYGLDLMPASVIEWHATELLFGFAPAVLAGFLLTALPRWTGCHCIDARSLWLLIAVWIAGRLAGIHELFGGSSVPAALAQSAFVLILAGIVAYRVVAARIRRNYWIVILLALLGASAWIARLDFDGGEAGALGLRSGLAAMIGLTIILGGRIIPSLSQAWLTTQGRSSGKEPEPMIEYPAAAAAAAALAVWVVATPMVPIGLLCAMAAVLQAMRLAQWRADQVAAKPDVLAVHIAYLFVPVGFILIAVGSVGRFSNAFDAAIHAWASGAIGLMTLAVMASMIRRQTGRPFQKAHLATVAFVLCLIAAATRMGAAFATELFHPLVMLAAACWTAAFVLFLLTFAGALLRPGAAARNPLAESGHYISARDRGPALVSAEEVERDGWYACCAAGLARVVAHADRQAWLMGRMMQRLGIDAWGATCRDPIAAGSIARVCFVCRQGQVCDAWLSTETSSEPPAFCPNRLGFRRMPKRFG